MNNNVAPKQPPPLRWKPDEINENLRIKYEGEAKCAVALSPFRIAVCNAIALVSCVFLALMLKPDVGGFLSGSIVGSIAAWIRKRFAGT
jgi:hypothetical protein